MKSSSGPRPILKRKLPMSRKSSDDNSDGDDHGSTNSADRKSPDVEEQEGNEKKGLLERNDSSEPEMTSV